MESSFLRFHHKLKPPAAIAVKRIIPASINSNENSTTITDHTKDKSFPCLFFPEIMKIQTNCLISQNIRRTIKKNAQDNKMTNGFDLIEIDWITAKMYGKNLKKRYNTIPFSKNGIEPCENIDEKVNEILDMIDYAITDQKKENWEKDPSW